MKAPWLVAAVVATAGAQVSAAPPTGPRWQVEGGDVARGRRLVVEAGCARCHTVPGVRGADANVGPSLERIGSRTYIAGMLRNEPANLMRWLREPQSVIPGNAMPDTGLTDQQARDIAAFLYTLR